MRLRQLKHMFKNSYKNATKNKAQVFGVIILVFFLSLVLSTLVSLNVRVITKYNDVLIQSNVHDAVIDLNPYESVATGETKDTPDAPKNLIEAQQYWVQQLQEQYAIEDPDLEFDWSRTEAREFSQVQNDGNDITIKAINKTSQAVEYNELNTNPVDQLVIFEGQNIETMHQVVIDKNFAQQHNIELGSVIRIQADNLGDSLLVKNSNDDQNLIDNIGEIEALGNQIDSETGIYKTLYSNYQWYQVVGFGISADFVTPILSETKPLPNRTNEMILYASNEAFGLTLNEKNGLYSYNVNAFGNLNVTSSSEQESFYSIKFKNNSTPSQTQYDQIESDFRALIRKNINNKIVYSKADPTYRFSQRLSFLQQTIIGYNIASFIVFISILTVVLYSVSLITKKQIENASRQLGTLKALGYRKKILVFNFIMLPFLTSLIGGVVGYFASIFVSNVITNEFASYFSLNYPSFEIDWVSFVLMILVVWIVLTVIAFSIAILLMRKSALSLLSKMNNQRPNALKRFISKIKIRRSFSAKLRKALLVDALGKISAIGAVVLASSALFTISFAAPNILSKNQEYSVKGIDYNQIIEYAEPSYNNPLSFLKTFKPEAENHRLQYGKNVQGWTSLPLTNTGSIDMDQVVSDYYNGNITNKYYSIFVDSYIKQESADGNVIPTLLEFAIANMKMLNLDGVIFDTNYFKEIAKYGIPPVMGDDQLENLILPTIINQWFDYQNLLAQIQNNSQETDFAAKIANAQALQTFYKKQSQTIGLSVTNDFRVGKYASITEKEWIDKTDFEKIDIFNDAANNTANLELKKKYLSNNEAMLKQLLGENYSVEKLANDANYDLDFQYTTKDWTDLGLYKINDKNNSDKTAANDYYVGIDFSQLDENNEADLQTLDYALVQYWQWFTFMCFNRVDQSIIQTSFSRPPYFVQQNINKAYNELDKNFAMSFNLVPFNDDYEALGTLMNAEKNGVNFKIYGIEDNSEFLDLKNVNGDDLLSKLHDYEADNGIIINQSLAKTLNLQPGDEVDFNIIQNELQEHNGDQTAAYKLEDWDTRGFWSGKDGFKQSSRTGKFSSVNVTTPIYGHTNSINYLSSISSPSNYYQTVLSGNTVIGTKTTSKKFKVIDVQDGYGTAQAWVKNDYANKVLGYDKIQEYFWTNYFARQWNNEFGSNISWDDTKTTILLEDEANQEIKQIKKINQLDLTSTGNNDLNEFKKQYIESPTVDPSEKELAEVILQVFENQFPVFNYKYSNSTDIGDYGTTLAISNKYGDYTPTSLNGMIAEKSGTGEAFDGAASGAIGTMFYIETYKEILEQISQVIMVILALIIVLIISIAFVIIELTTSIVINDNIRFISTMRVLGYTDNYVVKTVMGMYAAIIGAMFVLGYVAGWFIFAKVVGVLAVAGTVLPLAHPIWLPFAVGIGIIGMYIIAIWIGYKNITKINSVQILQNSDI